ncbi:CPBP family intramembrane metalloprotease [Flavobacteriaceae bacterium AH-315-B10]|nr:CPBP family intramembrane metalloprotease [Flavobacteriaceae bacterium AH-315-B10]
MKIKFRQFQYILFFLSISSYAQDVLVNQSNSFELFAETLNNSKDTRFQEILIKYDNYINKHPDDVEVKLYRCKFIGSAYYDEYEGYDLNYEETEKCIEKLYQSNPNHPSVILYKLESLYGEERGGFLNEILTSYNIDKSKWNYYQTSKLFEIGANYFSEDNDFKALSYAEKAERFSDSLDLSILISNIHLRIGNKASALENIMSSLHLDGEAWELNQKGNILIELGEYSEALKIFERVRQKDSTLVNNESLYRIFLKENDYQLARNYLIKDTILEWNRFSSLQKLLNHDIKYSDSETALKSYRRVQQENYYDDFFGMKRLKIFFKAPFKLWTFGELSHILILIIFILITFLIPYLWVLPVYALGKYFSKKFIKSKPKLEVDWTLKHFWLISFFYLLSQTIITLVFYYQDYINSFFEVTQSYYDDMIIEDELTVANSLIIFSILLFVSTLIFINKNRIKFILNSNLRLTRMIVLGILFVIGNGIILKLFGGFIDITEAVNFVKTLSIKEEILMLMNNYGLTISVLLVAVIVPFSEEIIFRGIIFSSSEKHIGFKFANILQAFLFAVVHFSLHLFIFYFIFGLILGYTVKKTNGLLTAIIFHAINNFFVLLLLYYISRMSTPFLGL